MTFMFFASFAICFTSTVEGLAVAELYISLLGWLCRHFSFSFYNSVFWTPFTVDVWTWKRSNQQDLWGTARGARCQKTTTRRSKVQDCCVKRSFFKKTDKQMLNFSLDFSLTLFIMVFFFSVSDKNCVYLIIFRKYIRIKVFWCYSFQHLSLGSLWKLHVHFSSGRLTASLNFLLYSKPEPYFFFSWQTWGRVLHQSQICGSSVCTSAIRWGASQQSGFSE